METLAAFIIFITATAAIIFLLYKYRAKRPSPVHIPSVEDAEDLSKISIDDIDRMEDGSGFELYIARLLAELGYDGVYKTVGSRDFGADVVFIDRQGNQTVIQAKRYGQDHNVGLSAVQEVFASKRYYKAKNAIVIATTRFTDSCETLAGVNHVLLLDRNDLVQIIDYYKQGALDQAKNMIESEPRMILESWNSMRDSYQVIKKDMKADRMINKKTS